MEGERGLMRGVAEAQGGGGVQGWRVIAPGPGSAGAPLLRMMPAHCSALGYDSLHSSARVVHL